MIKEIIICDQCRNELPRKDYSMRENHHESQFYQRAFTISLEPNSFIKQSSDKKMYIKSSVKRLDFCSYNCFDKYLEENVK